MFNQFTITNPKTITLMNQSHDIRLYMNEMEIMGDLWSEQDLEFYKYIESLLIEIEEEIYQLQVFETLDRKAAQLIEQIEVAEYELDYLNEMYQVTGEPKLEDKARVYAQLAKLNQELIDTNLELDKYYVAEHIEELNLFF